MENPQKQRSNLHPHSSSYKINSIRFKLTNYPNILSQFDQLLASFSSGIDSNHQANTLLEHLLKNIIGNLKTILTQPSRWFQSQRERSKGKESAILLESKMLQLNEIYNDIAGNALLIERLNHIKIKDKVEGNVEKLSLGAGKQELLMFYKEITDYHRCRTYINKNKARMNTKEMTQANSEMGLCPQIKVQMEEMMKNEQLLSNISNKFIEIQQHLLGFKLTNIKLTKFEEVQAKLEKILTYVKDSYQVKENDRTTPKNVKDYNEIMQILSLLCNSNIGLMEDKIRVLENRHMKDVFTKIMQNLIKKAKSSEDIYDFLLQNMNEKARNRYPKSIKHLSLQRKLGECEKVIKQLKKTSQILAFNPEVQPQFSHLTQASKIRQIQAIEQALTISKLENDQQLLLAEQQIYTLQMKQQSLIKQNQQLRIEIQSKVQAFQAQKRTFEALINHIRDEYKQMMANNQGLLADLQESRSNNENASMKLIEKQEEIIEKDQNLMNVVNKINEMVQKKEEQIFEVIKGIEFQLYSRVYQIRIDPTVLELKIIEEEFNSTSEIPLKDNNPQKSKETIPQSPPIKKIMKHSRSLSNVDFYSELMPEITQKDLQDRVLQGTFESEQLRKGIQLREKTIKKYESYMEKQRKEAKKHRSQILELQSKIRNLELEQIRLKQMIEHQSSEKYLQFDEEDDNSTCKADESEKGEEIGSIEKISEKEVELKVKEQELDFKIEEIIQHVLKLNTLKAIRQNSLEEQIINTSQFNPQSKHLREIQ